MLRFSLVSLVKYRIIYSEQAVKFPKAQPLDSPKCQKWDSLEAQYALKSPNFGEFRIFELNDLGVIYQLWWEDNLWDFGASRGTSDQGV